MTSQGMSSRHKKKSTCSRTERRQAHKFYCCFPFLLSAPRLNNADEGTSGLQSEVLGWCDTNTCLPPFHLYKNGEMKNRHSKIHFMTVGINKSVAQKDIQFLPFSKGYLSTYFLFKFHNLSRTF